MGAVFPQLLLTLVTMMAFWTVLMFDYVHKLLPNPKVTVYHTRLDAEIVNQDESVLLRNIFQKEPSRNNAVKFAIHQHSGAILQKEKKLLEYIGNETDYIKARSHKKNIFDHERSFMKIRNAQNVTERNSENYDYQSRRRIDDTQRAVGELSGTAIKDLDRKGVKMVKGVKTTSKAVDHEAVESIKPDISSMVAHQRNQYANKRKELQFIRHKAAVRGINLDKSSAIKPIVTVLNDRKDIHHLPASVRSLKLNRSQFANSQIDSHGGNKPASKNNGLPQIIVHPKNSFQHYSFNITASSMLSVNRSIPDTRSNKPLTTLKQPGSYHVVDTGLQVEEVGVSEENHRVVTSTCQLPRIIPPHNAQHRCLSQTYDQNVLPSASIIICFHNEASSVLLRTVYSVLNRTPGSILKEIILINDDSSPDDFDEATEIHLRSLSKVRLFHAKKREGLIRSRLIGAEKATGETIVFLDSHCECNVGWLEPLLHRIAQDKQKVVSPEIDIIKFDTFEYVKAPNNLHGGFTWQLQFLWKPIPEYLLKQRISEIHPIRTPTISGGIYAINRDYFLQLGGYDKDLEIWGGENMELSFKVWMCGGSLEIVPCSKVGHVFRNIIPYSFPQGGQNTIWRNSARVAEVWMDNYKKYFYASQATSSTNDGMLGDLQERKTLRIKLHCKSFQWYLKNIIPELDIPPDDAVFYGELKNSRSLTCLEGVVNQSVEVLSLSACMGKHKQQIFSLRTNGSLQTYTNSCLVVDEEYSVGIGQCGQNTWVAQENMIRNVQHDMCLSSVENQFVKLDRCEIKNTAQIWTPTYLFNWKHHKT